MEERKSDLTTFTVNQLPDRTIRYEGREYLFFSGTSYLGMSQNPAFRQLVTGAIEQYGTSYGSSRNGNVELAVYAEAEAKLARRVGAEAALTLSSGMMAGQVVVQHLRARHTQFVYGPQTHPALWHESTVELPATSFADWIAQLPAQLNALPPGPVAILINSVDALRSAYYDFTWITGLPTGQDITIVVDDSHGLGLLHGGSGIWPELVQKPGIRVLVTASLGKAMGLPGGVIFGDTGRLTALRRTAFFGGCSPIPPAYLAAYCRADEVYQQAYSQLKENIKLAEALLDKTALFSHAKGYPIFYTERDDLYPFLLEHGILAYSFAYPTPQSPANTRLVISAYHTFGDIQKLANALYTYLF